MKHSRYHPMYYDITWTEDQNLWGLAVWLMDRELGDLGFECHCQGCGVK